MVINKAVEIVPVTSGKALPMVIMGVIKTGLYKAGTEVTRLNYLRKALISMKPSSPVMAQEDQQDTQ